MRPVSTTQIGHWPRILVLWVTLIVLVPTIATAGVFDRLQVLLPGESAAPGTPGGKSGTPDAQIVGVPFEVVIRACDGNWFIVPNIVDVVSWQSSDATATLPLAAALLAGQMTATVTLHSAGTFTISGQDLGDTAIPEGFSAGVVAVVMAGFEFAGIAPRDQVAGQPITVVVTAVDPSGNPVGGYSGPVSLQQFTSTGQGRMSPEIITLSAGAWTGEVQLFLADDTSPTRGNVNLHAFLPADISINGSSNYFRVLPGVLKRIQLLLPGQTAHPGTIDGLTGAAASQGAMQPFTISLQSSDDYWNPVPANDLVRIVSSDPGFAEPTPISLSEGTASASIQFATAGIFTLTASDLSNGTVRAMTSVPVVVAPIFADHFVFDPLPAVVVAGGGTVVHVRAVDLAGNTMLNFNGDARLMASTGPGTIFPETLTFNSGQGGAVLQFRAAGDAVQLTCADFASPAHTGVSSGVQVLPGPYVQTQVIMPGQTPQAGSAAGVAGVPLAQDAGQVFTVQIRAVDNFFNRVPGISNALAIHSVDTYFLVPGSVVLVDGEVSVPVTVYGAGRRTFSAADLTSGGIASPLSSMLNVSTGPYVQLALLAPGETLSPGSTSGRVGVATDQSVTFAFTLIAMSVDAWYNQVTGIADIIHLTSTDPAATLPPDLALNNGMAHLEVRLATGGYQQFTVTSVSRPATTGSMTQVRAISSGLHLRAALAEMVIQAGVSFSLDVSVVNDAGTVMQEINDQVQISVRQAESGLPGRGTLSATTFQLIQGRRHLNLSYTYAEDIILEVTSVNEATPGLTGTLAVEPGAPAGLTLTSDPGWVRGNRTAVLSAVLSDAFGNPIAGRPVSFAAAANDSGYLGDHAAKTGEKTVVALTDAAGLAQVDYHSPRQRQTVQITASSGQITAAYGLQTALVDPAAAGGYLTSYPNPFHPNETATTIAYVLDDAATVRLRVYTISGGLVLDRQYPSGGAGGQTGLNEIQWDGRNAAGEPVASGGYIVYVQAAGNGATQHVMRRKIGVVW